MTIQRLLNVWCGLNGRGVKGLAADRDPAGPRQAYFLPNPRLEVQLMHTLRRLLARVPPRPVLLALAVPLVVAACNNGKGGSGY